MLDVMQGIVVPVDRDVYRLHEGVRLVLVPHVSHVAAVFVAHVIRHDLTSAVGQVHKVGSLKYVAERRSNSKILSTTGHCWSYTNVLYTMYICFHFI